MPKLTTPCVKNNVTRNIPSKVHLKGWLMKQKHGKFKGFQKRFFMLFDGELRYYKSQNDTVALAVISLDHYTFTPCSHIQNKLFIFGLLSDDESKYDWPDYFLQAESKDECQMWVDSLQQRTTELSVLDKWLERLEVPNTRDSFYSERNTSVPTLQLNEEDEQSSIASSTCLTSNFKHHKSTKSISRHPSKALFPYRLFNWTSNHTSLISMLQEEPIHTTKALEPPILHPNEYT